MNDQARRFPLAWPMDWKRTPPDKRERASFRRTVKTPTRVVKDDKTVTEGTRETTRPVNVAEAIDRLEAEVTRLGADDPILSTNLPIGLRGVPLGNQEPRDGGAALYVVLHGKPLVFACDKWNRVADNIAAIAQHIDALRRIDRYGVGKLDQAFHGYAALPPSADDWRIVLGVGEYATLDQVDAAFLEKAKTMHPDVGGRSDDMAKLTAARDLARKVLGG